MWGECVDGGRGHQRKQRTDIDSRGLHQCRSECGVAEGVFQRTRDPVEDGTNQRIAVRVRPAGGETEQHIAGADPAAVDQVTAIDAAEREPGEVVVAGCIHARHFRRFAANQGTTGLFAAGRDTVDHVHGLLLIQHTGGEIVQKQQRFGAAHDDVVDAHSDKVDADGCVLAGFPGQRQFGADAVRTRDQHRLIEAAKVQLEQATEAPDTGQHFGAMCVRTAAGDAADESIAGVDIHACVFVSEHAEIIS